MKLAYLLFPALILSLSACSGHKDPQESVNKEASLPASFNFSKLGLKVISSSVNQKNSTMSTLYGNDLALKVAKTGSAVQPDEVLAMITWKQQEDKRWFGAKIPGQIVSLEMLKTTRGITTESIIDYQRFEGSKLALKKDTAGDAESINYIFAQKPSVMP
jgi:hypothetical protein